MLHPGTATVGRPQLCHNQLPITLDCTLRSIELLTSCFADCDSMKKCEVTSNTAANATTKPAIAKSAPSSITPPPEFILKLTRSTNGRSIKREKAAIIVRWKLPGVPLLQRTMIMRLNRDRLVGAFHHLSADRLSQRIKDLTIGYGKGKHRRCQAPAP